MLTPGGQAGRDLGDFSFDVLDDRKAVFAIAHNHNTADGFLAIHIQGAPPEVAAQLDRGDVAQIDGGAAVGLQHDASRDRREI